MNSPKSSEFTRRYRGEEKQMSPRAQSKGCHHGRTQAPSVRPRELLMVNLSGTDEQPGISVPFFPSPQTERPKEMLYRGDCFSNKRKLNWSHSELFKILDSDHQNLAKSSRNLKSQVSPSSEWVLGIDKWRITPISKNQVLLLSAFSYSESAASHHQLPNATHFCSPSAHAL